MEQILYPELRRAAFAAFGALAAAHADERFYCVALFTSGSYRYVYPTAATLEGVKSVARRYLEKPTYRALWGTQDVAMRELKWSLPDSPYHEDDAYDDQFDAVETIIMSLWQSIDENDDTQYSGVCKTVHRACYAVLTALRDSGLFDKEKVLFLLAMGDQGDEDRLASAEALNSPDLVKQFRSELIIDEIRLEAARQRLSDWCRL